MSLYIDYKKKKKYKITEQIIVDLFINLRCLGRIKNIADLSLLKKINKYY